MNLEHILLSEISEAQKEKNCMTSLTRGISTSKTGRRKVVDYQEPGGGGNGAMLVKYIEVHNLG